MTSIPYICCCQSPTPGGSYGHERPYKKRRRPICRGPELVKHMCILVEYKLILHQHGDDDTRRIRRARDGNLEKLGYDTHTL